MTAASCVLDASAVLAFLLDEEGAAAAAERVRGGVLSAVNYSEVVARALEWRVPLEVVTFELGRLPLAVVPYDEGLATLTATLKEPTRTHGLSFADRACLALGLDRRLPVVTADRQWRTLDIGVEVILIR